MLKSARAIRRFSLVLTSVLAVCTSSAWAAGKYEPAGFIPPANLQQAMRKGRAAVQAPVQPPSYVALPTPGTGATRTPLRSPWIYETEFGDSGKRRLPTPVLNRSALQGGTTMMLSTLPTAVGRLPGSYSVSSTGAALYSIPIWTPPGVRGIQPNLALNYSSAGGDSWMGQGWSLSGLSNITRCRGTPVQDGHRGLTEFCLDGNKLRLTSAPGTFGAANSTYQTEIDTFSRVKANGQLNGVPQSWTVHGKDGLIYEYGGTIDSRLAGTSTAAYLWALNKVSDRVGNYMTISYTLSDGTYRPTEINYTRTPLYSTFYYKVSFEYESRDDVSEVVGYMEGSEIKQTKVLTSITVKHSGSTVRTYNLDYSTSPTTNRIRLSAVQTCSTTDCLKPTIIEYQDGSAGIGAPSTSAGTGATSGKMSTVDVDGDGKDDLVYATTSGGTDTWYVKFATATGFGSAVATGLATSSATAVLFDDLLANGRTCLLGLQSTTWYANCWNGSSFTLASSGVALASGLSGAEGQYVVADIDGDGRSDLVRSDMNRKIYLRLNTSTGATVSFASETVALDMATYLPTAPNTGNFVITRLQGNNSVQGSSVHKVDYDGNGTDDVLMFTQDTPPFPVIYALTSSGNTLKWRPPYGDFIGTVSATPINFNDDSCTDFVGTYSAPGSSDAVHISPCGGDGGFISTGIHHGLLADYNGDGRTDIWYESGGVFRVMISQADSLAAAFSTGMSVGSGVYQAYDHDGDGLDDLAFANSGSSYAISYGLHAGAGVRPDLATLFTDGFEMNASFAYKPISLTEIEGGCAFRDGAVPTYPNRPLNDPLHVACTMGATDGVGGTYSVAHDYYNANLNLQGRGFLGFQRHYSADDRNGILNQETYEQEFPYIGMPKYSASKQPSTLALIREVEYTLDTKSNGAGYDAREAPFAWKVKEKAYEVGGILNATLLMEKLTTTTMGSYGAPTNVEVATTDKIVSPNETYTVVTNHPNMLNDTTYWCVGRPEKTTVTSTIPIYGSQTRTTEFDIDPDKCRMTEEVIEPASPTMRIATTYGFDSCGNTDSVSVVGIAQGTNLPARGSASNYGARCQFPESTTNAIGQVSSATYDYSLGRVSSQTDANGITVSWIYDAYGRKVQETRPDGTSTIWTFFSCESTSSYCNAPTDLRWGVTQTDRNTSLVSILQKEMYFDGFDRQRYSNWRKVSGALVLDSLWYDPLGRVVLRFEPDVTTASYHLYTYDILNRLRRDTSFLAAASSRETTMEYEGPKVVVADAEGNITYRYSDVRGNLRRVDDAVSGGVTSYVWNHFGYLKSTTDAAGVISNSSYTVRGFKYESDDPDAGVWVYAGNSFGEVTHIRDAKTSSPNWTTEIEYDRLGRMIMRKDVPENKTSTWSWGNSSVLKNIGKLHCVNAQASYSCTDPTSNYREVYSYDSLGRPSGTTYHTDALTSYQVDYAYNASTGFLDNITYPESTSSYRLRTQFLYQNGILNKIRDYNAPSTVWWELISDDARGTPIDEHFGNGVHVLAETNDLTGELKKRYSGNAGLYDNHQHINYEWDLNGNLKKRIDLNQVNLTEEFFYDELDRLKESKRGGTTNLLLTFGAAGNILTRQDEGGANKTFTYTGSQSGCSYYAHAQPHAVRNVNGVIYCYDANGNMVKRGGVTQSWYSFNLPHILDNGSQSSEFFYTPDRQYWKQVATYPSSIMETSIYIGGLMEKVTRSGVTDYRHMIRAGSATVIVERSSSGSNETYYTTQDHLGSSAVVTDSTGNVVVKQSFGAYGNRRDTDWLGPVSAGDMTATAGVTRRGFTEHTMLDNLDLIHMNGRVYDPMIGRFMSPDPIIKSLSNSQNLNPYSYVNNNPLTLVDPSGFTWECSSASGAGGNGVANNFNCYYSWGGSILDINFAGGRPTGEDGPYSFYFADSGIAPIDINATTFPMLLRHNNLPMDSTLSPTRFGQCIGTPEQCGNYSFWRHNSLGKFISSILGDPFARTNDGINPISGIWLTRKEQFDGQFFGLMSIAAPLTRFGATARGLEFSELTNRELNLMMGDEQRELIRQFLGRGLPGASARAGGFDIPVGLSRESLRIYGEIARRAIAEGIDKSGVQLERLKLIERALEAW